MFILKQCFISVSILFVCSAFLQSVTRRSFVSLAMANEAGPMKLIYFDAKGAAELSRVLLKIGGIEFIDERFSMKMKEGGGFITPEFDEAKKSGLLACNMNRAPVLVLNNGLKLGQSRTIEKYIAKKCNLMGSTDEDFSFIDCVAENVRDIREKYSKIKFTGGMGASPEKELAIKKWYDEEFSAWLMKLEESLPEGSVGFSVGNELSYADVGIWHLLNEVHDNKEAVSKALEKCPRLAGINKNVAHIESLKDWLAQRPATSF